MNKERLLASLTAREGELVSFLVKGQSNAQISEGMMISLNTVKTHLKNIYSKLEVKNRQELIVAFLSSESEGPAKS
jgi:DNA-binding CsgD family transcriptional regulator